MPEDVATSKVAIWNIKFATENEARWSERLLELFGNDQKKEFLSLTKPVIAKQKTNIRESMPANLKLAVTICYLSTGARFTDLQHIFRVHQTTISIRVNVSNRLVIHSTLNNCLYY